MNPPVSRRTGIRGDLGEALCRHLQTSMPTMYLGAWRLATRRKQHRLLGIPARLVPPSDSTHRMRWGLRSINEVHINVARMTGPASEVSDPLRLVVDGAAKCERMRSRPWRSGPCPGSCKGQACDEPLPLVGVHL